MTSTVITGGNGFVGSHLVEYLAVRNHAVHVLLRKGSKLPERLATNNLVNVHTLEITSENVYSIIKDIKPDLIIHTAGLFVMNHHPSQIEELTNSNINYGIYLLDAASKLGIKKFINTGTSWEHSEGGERKAVNLYAASKHAFQAFVEFYSLRYNIDAVTLKLFDTYGPNDARGKIVSTLIKMLETKKDLALSPGGQLINMVYISDVCNAYLQVINLLLNNDMKGCKEFGVASREPVTLRSLVDSFEKISGTDLKITWGGRQYRDFEVMIPWTNFERIPNWEEKVTLDDGLLTCINAKWTTIAY